MSKRRIELMTIILFLAMCISAVSTTTAFAEDKATNVSATTGSAVSVDEKGTIVEEGKNELVNSSVTDALDFEFDAETGTITKYISSDTEVVIPSEINGVKVTSIGPYAFRECYNLKVVIIPSSVTSIGDSAFYDCTSLTAVTIQNGVTSIGSKAFYECLNLKTVKIPNSVTSIGDRAFVGCDNLTEITIPNSVTSIGRGMFFGCLNLKTVTIPSSVTSIGESAFQWCGLTTITIPNSVTSIDTWAFAGTNLTTVTIPNSVTSMGTKVFSDCKNLRTVTISNSVTSIGMYAFSRCISLTTVKIPNSVTSIDDYAFSDCTSLRTVMIPNSVTSIGWWAFSGCTSLKELTIPNSLTGIGWGAFSGCTSLKELTIPNSVTYISRGAFSGCTSLKELTIPNSVTDIYQGAFSECINLKTVTIPNSKTSVSKDAFSYCTNLNKVYTPITPIPSYTYINRTNIFKDSPTVSFYDISKSSLIPEEVTVNKPQTLTKLADNIEIKSDKAEEKDGIITYTGNIAINDYLKLNGKLEKDTKNLTLKGEGQLYLETNSSNFPGVINLYKGKFELKADGAKILKAAGVDKLKIADMEFSISKLQLISGGVRLGGSLKLPKNIGGGGVTVDTIEIVNGKIGFPSGKISLPEFKLGKSAIGLSDAYLSYDSEKNYFEGAGTITIPKLFAVNSTVGIENAKLEKVSIGISGMNVAIGASGLFLNSAYGEVDGLATPPLVLKAKMDVSGGPKIADTNIIKGKDLTINVDMSGVLSGSGKLELMSIPLSSAKFEMKSGKSFEASAYINAADIIKGNCHLYVYNNPKLTIQGDGLVSVNIPKIGQISETTGYFDNEKIMAGADVGIAKGVAWVKYTGEWGFDFNADLKQMTNSSSMESRAISLKSNIISEQSNNISTISNINSMTFNTISMPANGISIDSGMDKALVKITYSDGTGDIVLIAPNGTRITPENSGMNSKISNYIKIDNQKTIYYVLNNPQAGQWQYELVNSTFTGLQIETGKIKNNPVLNFVYSQSGDIEIDVSNTSVDIPIKWQCSKTDGTIDILYSTKSNDKFGIPLATGVDVNSGSYTWTVNNKITTGKYYITVIFHSNGIVPIYAYYNSAVKITNSATPKAPSNVTVSASNGNVNVSWKTNTNVTGYNIYVSDGTNEKVFNVGFCDNFQVNGLENEKSYSIQMTAINNLDLESEKSSPVNIYLPKPLPPELNVEWSADKYLNDGTLSIKGSADSSATVQVFINDTLAEENLVGSFDKAVMLTEGKNEIRVVATKANGDSTEKINTYWYDLTPPQLSVKDIYDGMIINSPDYVVRGKVEPNVSLLINGKETTEKNGEFSYDLSLVSGINNITISATDAAGNKTEFFGTITVNTTPVTSVSLDKTEVSLKVGETTKLVAGVNPTNAINQAITWISDNPSIASVDENGVITALGAGTAIITVTTVDGRKSATCVVTVTNPVAVTGITLNSTTLSVLKGNTAVLAATVAPSNASNIAVTWKSSNTAVATVDSTGKVTGVAAGTAIITCTASDGSGKSVTCVITVTNPIAVTEITLNSTTLNVVKGNTSTLTATLAPSNASNKGVTWKSSNTAVATVDSTGKVTGVGAGTATITCTANDGSGKSATCIVTVTNPIAVTGITLNSTTLSVVKGNTGNLTATLAPSNASNKGVTWKSSNTAVATVDSTGKVTGVGAGTATITCTANDGSGKSVNCAVIVTDHITVTDITLNSKNLSLVKGSTGNLIATVVPSNATNKALTWSSSDEHVATVDSNGKITAIGDGSATITCTSTDGSNKSAKCTVTVANPVKIRSIQLNKADLNITKGNTFQLIARIYPSDASDKILKWSSRDENVATVDQTGKVTAIGIGRTYITCAATDGSYESNQCAINVKSDVTDISDFEFDKKTGTIKKYHGDAIEITIPSAINGVKVTGISRYALPYNLISITIPDSVTNISDGTFWSDDLEKITVDKNNKNYTSVDGILFDKSKTKLIAYPAAKAGTTYTIPSTVKEISDWAFEDCNNLTDIIIPDSVISIGEDSFRWNEDLQKITVDKNNKNYLSVDGVLFNKEKTKLITYPAAKTETTYTIPTTVKEIPYSAFDDSSNLISITIPDSVTSISEGAFVCENLEKITVDKNNKNYLSVDGILFNKSKTEIIKYPANKADTKYTIPSSVTSIESDAFSECSNLTTVTIPNSVTSIESDAFEGCRSLTSIIIPNSVTSIGEYAFNRCESLASITLPNKITSIEDDTFEDCRSLTSIIIPNSVASIGEYAFNGCESLASITLPNKITSIEDDAFSDCTGLTSITIPESVASIGDWAFGGCDNAKFYVGSEEVKELLLNSYSDIDESRIIIESQSSTVQVTGVKLSNTSLSLIKGNTVTLIATIDPSNATNKNVTWKSSNTSVATVDSTGKVTGVAAGTATITCTASDGSGKSVTCVVTVTNPIIATGITLNNTTLNVVKGNTAVLAATVAPSNASNKAVTWKSSNTAIATVDSTGKVMGVAAGTATITCTVSDGSGKSSTCAVTVTNPITATGITLNNITLNVVKGNTAVLAATVSPSNASNKAVTWKSSNTAVATVDSTGKVTGVAAGTATITCTAGDGSGKSVTCAVTVTNPVAVTGITLNSTTLSVVKGNATTLVATVAPSNAGNKTVTWKSSNTAVATVDSTGKVTGIVPGTATITCTANDGSGKSVTCVVAVTNPVAVTGITLNSKTLSIVKGNTGNLVANVAPSTATNKTVNWKSSNTAVATIDSTGKVTGVTAGTSTITCTAGDGSGKSVTCVVTVTNPVAVTGITLNNTTLNVVKGNTAVLAATVSPSNASNKAVTWKSSNTAVATVDSTGKVTGVAAGTATITCTAGDGSGKSVTCAVTVTNPITVTGITLNSKTLSIVKGNIGNLAATVAPSTATNKAVTWKSSNTSVATVDSTGKVTGVAAGTATITCTAGDGSGKSVTCAVTVTNPITVTGITLNSKTLSIVKGNTGNLVATIAPSTATNKTVNWKSSNTAVATVDSTGKVTGVAAGTATITCTAGDGSGKSITCAVTVTNPITVTGITLNSKTLSIVKGNTGNLVATVAPSTATNKAVTWKSSNTSVATVDSTGKVTGVGAGIATITCTASDGSGKSITCVVTVTNPITATGITLNSKTLSVVKGNTGNLVATVAPSTATNKAVTWKSSNTSVATVDSTGKVTGVAAGTATITCTAGDGSGKSVTCAVTVTNPVAVTGITLNSKTLSIVKGNATALVATVAPSNASNKALTWKSSNTAVATVDSTGKVTGVAAGTATITCTASDRSGKSGTCAVTVTNPITATGITLNSKTLSIVKGNTGNLTATVAPSNVTNKSVTWKSSNTAVATVDSTGKVTGVAVGSATITCTASDGSGKSVTCAVTVTNPITATGITLNSKTLSIVKGNTGNLTATVAPSNVSNKSLTWKSSSTAVATVDSTGKVTGVAAGSATITCTANDGSGKSVSCAVTVTK